MMTVALGIFVITYFLSHFGQEAVAAYGVATRIEQLVLLPTIGLNTAALTLTAQNGGAGLYERVRQTVRKALIYGGFMTAGGSVLLYFGAEFRSITNTSTFGNGLRCTEPMTSAGSAVAARAASAGSLTESHGLATVAATEIRKLFFPRS